MNRLSMFALPSVRRWVMFCAALGLACLLGACSKFDSTQNAHNGPPMTAKVFDSTFTDVKGKTVDLSGLRGKTVVVNFWSTWCPPCIEEMPMFNEVQAQWQDKGVVFVGIAADQADNVKAFLKKTPISYPIVIGGQPALDLSRELGNRYDAIPFTVIINKQQVVASRHFGIFTRKDLEAELKKVAQ